MYSFNVKDCGCNRYYVPEPMEIIDKQPMTEDTTLYRIKWKDKPSHRPGQFVECSVLGYGEVPISICSGAHKENILELCISRVGVVTDVIHKLGRGALLGIRGPYGNGIDLSRIKGKNLVIIAGGLGIAPLRSLIEEVYANRGDYGEVKILYGTRSTLDLLFKDEYELWKKSDMEMYFTVDVADDSWKGNVGLITRLFRLVKIPSENTAAAVIGSPAMYKFVVKELEKFNIDYSDIYLSLERHMKCGVGKCGHCQINDIYPCKDGPVFNYLDILKLEESLQ